MPTRRLLAAVALVVMSTCVAACGSASPRDVRPPATTPASRTATTDPAPDHPGVPGSSTTAPPTSPSGGTATAPASPSTQPVNASLQITVDDGARHRRVVAVQCRAVTAASSNACGLLAGVRANVAALPADQACSQQYGGPETAHIVGTIDGRAVDVTVKRTNGCEISQWNLVAGLWGGSPGNATGQPK